MSDEKRAEYNQKRRMARADKKAASVISINPEEVSQTHASSSLDVPRTPFSNIANSNVTAATSAYTDHPSQDAALGRKKQSSEMWYARLSDEEKAEHCKKLRIARLEKKAATTRVQVSPGIAHLQTALSGVSHMLNSPCSGSSMQTDGHIDWLHTNPTYERQTMDVHEVFDMSQTEGMHRQETFLPGSNSLCSVQIYYVLVVKHKLQAQILMRLLTSRMKYEMFFHMLYMFNEPWLIDEKRMLYRIDERVVPPHEVGFVRLFPSAKGLGGILTCKGFNPSQSPSILFNPNLTKQGIFCPSLYHDPMFAFYLHML